MLFKELASRPVKGRKCRSRKPYWPKKLFAFAKDINGSSASYPPSHLMSSLSSSCWFRYSCMDLQSGSLRRPILLRAMSSARVFVILYCPLTYSQASSGSLNSSNLPRIAGSTHLGRRVPSSSFPTHCSPPRAA